MIETMDCLYSQHAVHTRWKYYSAFAFDINGHDLWYCLPCLSHVGLLIFLRDHNDDSAALLLARMCSDAVDYHSAAFESNQS